MYLKRITISLKAQLVTFKNIFSTFFVITNVAIFQSIQIELSSRQTQTPHEVASVGYVSSARRILRLSAVCLRHPRSCEQDKSTQNADVICLNIPSFKEPVLFGFSMSGNVTFSIS